MYPIYRRYSISSSVNLPTLTAQHLVLTVVLLLYVFRHRLFFRPSPPRHVSNYGSSSSSRSCCTRRRLPHQNRPAQYYPHYKSHHHYAIVGAAAIWPRNTYYLPRSALAFSQIDDGATVRSARDTTKNQNAHGKMGNVGAIDSDSTDTSLSLSLSLTNLIPVHKRR